MTDATIIHVLPAPLPLVADREVEMCEHKGVGHPDTIADGVCEAAARELARAYQRIFGDIQHFNVDKGLLVAGKSLPRFSGGRIVEPIKLIICGRATSLGLDMNVHDIVAGAARRYLQQNIRMGTARFEIIPEVKEGSANLKQVYAKGTVRVSNDTSFGVGYAPYSALERRVLQMAQVFKSGEFRRTFPAAGDDFKIMGLRSMQSFAFTAAIAFIDRHVENTAHYFAIKHAMHDYLLQRLEGNCHISLNALDDAQASDETGLYLTVTGLSAEMGDDGQVGRGNRVYGLIAPGRPMSLEAAAGKNPVSHVGKIYNVLAHLMARAICEQVPEVGEATVHILSTIGRPVDQPQAVSMEIAAPDGLTPLLTKQITAVAAGQLKRVGEMTGQLARGELAVY